MVDKQNENSKKENGAEVEAVAPGSISPGATIVRTIKTEEGEDVVKIVAPEPQEVDSKFVMECLVTDEEGDGMLFAALLEDRLLYATISDTWYVWQGTCWKQDRVGLILGLIRYVTDRYGAEIEAFEKKVAESKKINDPEDHKLFARSWENKIQLLQKKIRALRKVRGRNSCLTFAKTYFGNPFAIEGNEFDKDPWLLGVQNGVINLRTGELSAGTPAQMVSKQCSCNFSSLEAWQDKEDSPWLDFLHTIYNGDDELITFLQKMFGYSITGLTTEHIFPFLLGEGRNGKSLLVNSFLRVLDEYAAVIPVDLFLKTNQPRTSNQTDPGIMKLEGLRLAVSSEVEEGSRFSAQQVKRLTGGDILEGRSPYDKELRNFNPTHTVVVIGNHEPLPPSGDLAFFDRTYLINHPVRFVKEDPDPEKLEMLADPGMEKKLMEMDEDILCWLIEGCLLWQRDGLLVPPDSVKKDTREYQADADFVGQFIEACCEKSDTDVGATSLYIAFVEWYRENVNSSKTRTPSQRLFGMKMKRKVKATRKSDGIIYHNIALNMEWQNRMLQAARGESVSE